MMRQTTMDRCKGAEHLFQQQCAVITECQRRRSLEEHSRCVTAKDVVDLLLDLPVNVADLLGVHIVAQPIFQRLYGLAGLVQPGRVSVGFLDIGGGKVR